MFFVCVSSGHIIRTLNGINFVCVYVCLSVSLCLSATTLAPAREILSHE